MKRYWFLKRAMILSVCTTVACFGIAAGYLNRTVPISGNFGSSFELNYIAAQGIFQNSIQGVGYIPRLGVCTAIIDETVDLSTDPAIGTQNWVMTFVGGDQLTAILRGPGVFDSTDPAFVKGTLQGTITGGTGRFQGATGELRGPFAAHIDTAPGAFPAEGHGTIALEGWIRVKRN